MKRKLAPEALYHPYDQLLWKQPDQKADPLAGKKRITMHKSKKVRNLLEEIERQRQIDE